MQEESTAAGGDAAAESPSLPDQGGTQDLAEAVRGLKASVESLERRLQKPGSSLPDAADEGVTAPAPIPAPGPLNRLAGHYVSAEFLLAQADLLAGRDYRAAVELRMQAAQHVCAGLSAVVDDHAMATEMSDRIDAVRWPPQLASNDGQSQFLTVETRLLHLAGLPLTQAQDLMREGWHAHQVNPASRMSGEQVLTRIKLTRDLVCRTPDSFLAQLDVPVTDDPPPPAGEPLRQRAWWRRLTGRRMLYVVGGVLVTATNVAGAAVIEAAVAGAAGGSLVDVSIGVGTALTFK